MATKPSMHILKSFYWYLFVFERYVVVVGVKIEVSLVKTLCLNGKSWPQAKKVVFLKKKTSCLGRNKLMFESIISCLGTNDLICCVRFFRLGLRIFCKMYTSFSSCGKCKYRNIETFCLKAKKSRSNNIIRETKVLPKKKIRNKFFYTPTRPHRFV